MKNSWSQTSNFDMSGNRFKKAPTNDKLSKAVKSGDEESKGKIEKRTKMLSVSPCCRNPSEFGLKSGNSSEDDSNSYISIEDSLYSGKTDFLSKWSSRDVQLLSTENSIVYSESEEESRIDNLTYNIVTETSDESEGEETYLNHNFKNIATDEKGYSTESDSEELIKLDRSDPYHDYFSKILSELRSIKETLKRESIRNKVIFIEHPDISWKSSQKHINETVPHEFEYRKIDNDSLVTTSKNMLQHLLWNRQGDNAENPNEKLETIIERKDLSTGSIYRYIEQ